MYDCCVDVYYDSVKGDLTLVQLQLVKGLLDVCEAVLTFVLVLFMCCSF